MKDKGESKSGYYSSHGAMVPMGPAFTSDGSQYLGRPRRPRYSGSSGSPSMYADSGFSSVDGIARVNRGYEDEVEIDPMFPDQACDEDEDDFFLRTRKLPVYSLGSSPRRGSDLNPLKEGFIPDFVEDFLKSAGLSIPGVDILIGKMILDNEAEDGKIAIEEMCSIVGISPEDLAASLMDSNDDPTVLIIQKICSLSIQDRLDARDRFREFLGSLKDAIITIVQAYDSLVVAVAIPVPGDEPITLPAVNFISGLGGFFTRALPIERLIFNLSSRLARMFVGVIEVSEVLESVSPRYKDSIERIESGFGPIFVSIRQSPALSLSRLGSVYAGLNGDDSLCVVDDLPVSEEAEREMSEDTMHDEDGTESEYEEVAAVAPLTSIPESEDSSFFPEADGCACPISEARFLLLENRYNMLMRKLGMSESTLRQFVREMIRESEEKEPRDMPSRYGGEGYLPSDVLPYGQEYICDDEQEEREDISDEYAASYKGDMGYSAHSARPTNLSEIALRRIIREEAKKLLSNDRSKKKDDEEQDEASGAGAVGGVVTPIGTGPDGGIGDDDGARERSIYANERGFGGGKRKSSWMTYPQKRS